MEARLSKALLEARIEDTLKALRRIGDQRRKGYLTEDECRRLTEHYFWTGAWKLLDEAQLRLNVTAQNYSRFRQDRLNHSEGRALSEPDCGDWLTVDSDPRRTASREDRELVLYLLDRFQLPPEFFAPIPERVICPNWTCAHTWHDVSAMRTEFVCTDDGGLLTDPAPVGKTFRLVNDLGLEAVLTVKEDRRAENAQTDPALNARRIQDDVFLTEGYIEGYTAKNRSCKRPEIRVSLGKEPVLLLDWYDNSDDARARFAFPLWQDYFRECEQLRKRREGILGRLLEAPDQREEAPDKPPLP